MVDQRLPSAGSRKKKEEFHLLLPLKPSVTVELVAQLTDATRRAANESQNSDKAMTINFYFF